MCQLIRMIADVLFISNVMLMAIWSLFEIVKEIILLIFFKRETGIYDVVKDISLLLGMIIFFCITSYYSVSVLYAVIFENKLF